MKRWRHNFFQALFVLFVCSLLFQNCGFNLNSTSFESAGFADSSSRSGPEFSVAPDPTKNEILVNKVYMEIGEADTSFDFEILGDADSVSCRLNQSNSFPCQRSVDLNQAAEGENTLTISASFQDGKTLNKVITIFKDTMAPQITFNPPEPSTTVISQPTRRFQFAIADSGVGRTRTYCALNEKDFEPCTSPYTVSNMSDKSEHTLTLKTVDGMGNTKIETKGWSVNFAAISVTIENAPLDFTNTSNSDFTFSGGTTYKCELSKLDSPTSIETVPCAQMTRLSHLVDGQYRLNVVGIGPLNQLSDAKEKVWAIDRKLPEFKWLSFPSGTVTTASASFHFEAQDPGGELALVNQSTPVVEAPIVCLLTSPGRTVAEEVKCKSPYNIFFTTIGDYKLAVRVKDRAGNIFISDAKNWKYQPQQPSVKPDFLVREQRLAALKIQWEQARKEALGQYSTFNISNYQRFYFDLSRSVQGAGTFQNPFGTVGIADFVIPNASVALLFKGGTEHQLPSRVFGQTSSNISINLQPNQNIFIGSYNGADGQVSAKDVNKATLLSAAQVGDGGFKFTGQPVVTFLHTQNKRISVVSNIAFKNPHSLATSHSPIKFFGTGSGSTSIVELVDVLSFPESPLMNAPLEGREVMYSAAKVFEFSDSGPGAGNIKVAFSRSSQIEGDIVWTKHLGTNVNDRGQMDVFWNELIVANKRNVPGPDILHISRWDLTNAGAAYRHLIPKLNIESNWGQLSVDAKSGIFIFGARPDSADDISISHNRLIGLDISKSNVVYDKSGLVSSPTQSHTAINYWDFETPQTGIKIRNNYIDGFSMGAKITANTVFENNTYVRQFDGTGYDPKFYFGAGLYSADGAKVRNNAFFALGRIGGSAIQLSGSGKNEINGNVIKGAWTQATSGSNVNSVPINSSFSTQAATSSEMEIQILKSVTAVSP